MATTSLEKRLRAIEKTINSMPINYLYQRVSATEGDCRVQVVMTTETQHRHDHSNRSVQVENSDLILRQNNDVDSQQSLESSEHSQDEQAILVEDQHQQQHHRHPHRHDNVYDDESTVTVSASVVTSQAVPPDECCQHTTSTLLGANGVETHTNTNRNNHRTHCAHTLLL